MQLKQGGYDAFVWNRAQALLNARMEDQKRRTGRVRMLVPKARKLGVSTLIGARFYKKTSRGNGVNALVMAHDDTASSNLFDMVDTFHKRCPAEFRPKTGAANAKELSFVELGSTYYVRTAGGLEPGRSFTFHCFHGSEVAYWTHVKKILAGALNAVPDEPGTEIVLESTCNDPTDLYSRMVLAALRGENEYEVCFLAWHLDDSYRETPPPGWAPSAAWALYERQHGLTRDQTFWAYRKNHPLALANGDDPDAPCVAFKHEYPATVHEALESAGDELKRVIPLAWVRAAQDRRRQFLAAGGKPGEMTSMGVDVAQGGGDKSVIAPLHGQYFGDLIALPGVETPNGAVLAGQVLQHRRNRAQIVIDGGGGWGGSTYERLEEQGLPVFLFKPSDGSNWRSEQGHYEMRNRKAEALWKFREALDPEGPYKIMLPDDEEMVQDLIVWTFELTHGGVSIVESKQGNDKDGEGVRKKLGRSTDKGDAVLLAWVEPPGTSQADLAGHGSRPRVILGHSKSKGR